MSELVRFSITMPEDLSQALDEYAARRGTSKNRSETIRDLVREALVSEEVESPDTQIFGTLTMVFNHHASDLRDRLDDIQHEHIDEIITSLHVHVDHENCLEVILMKGRSDMVRSIADALLGTKGVLHGHLVVTTAGERSTHEHEQDCEHSHVHEHAQSHAHGHAHAHGEANA